MEILDKIRDTENFTVGGGAASALAGSKAAGMIGMVGNLSLKKEYGLSKKEYEEVVEKAINLSDGLLLGAQEDELAFCKIRDAFKLPKTTEFDKKVRKIAIQNGCIAAAIVPKENAYKCKEVYKLGISLIKKSNPNAESDLKIAIMLAELGIKGCVMNIQANLPMIDDESIKAGFEDHIKIIEND